MSLAPKEDPLTSQPCTIKITRGDLQQLELYSLYFENPKKSGGGIIKETRVDEKDHAVYITFEDPESGWLRDFYPVLGLSFHFFLF